MKAKLRVYTVHDAWSLAPNDYQSPAFQKKLGDRMRRDLASADLVMTDSHHTRTEILKYGLIGPGQCVALPIGVSIPDEASTDQSQPTVLHDVAQPYVLFVGRLENRKNIHHVLEAVRPVAGMHLVLVGEPGFGYQENIKPALASFPHERLVHLSRIAEHDLCWLYQHALVTLQPSWEEGFGLPVLEAMAAGCPVITSNRSATSEVAGDAAILVDPHAPEQSRQAVIRLLQDQQLRQRMIESGSRRAREYTWERYGKLAVAAYRELLRAF